MKCNEVQPRDGIKSALDGTPTTEKEASLSDQTSGEMVLGLSCRTYLKNVIPCIEEKLRETSGESKLTRTRVLTPMIEHYHPKEEVEMEVTENNVNYSD